ncbi:PREDICTED: butyrophilin subfamily 2 member A2-like isoform X1 [Corvus brachyrhynchos]|uniref:butyrophilin subfamily 2 member A2-like isoform X1 n=1 Tax=Corvus brachyrhynchos TaxID=85066 RepID=UPI0008164F93|nr:PREDICTED: butyrophilin subfamily 2 member A2-like isoform X1 [Corvus brachyrhynchos]XP_017583310.1 PREDICTED: butyrophilin subfamily 2 member A2-like isoform X1 [Corvus brachyrhynchos]
MEQRRWLLLALALLLAIPVSARCSLTDNFKLTSPEKVVGIVGQDTILPCTISSTKPLDNPQVHWIKITDGHTEDIYPHGQFGGEPMQKYCGRTSVPGDGFATGNVSLTLKNVQPADEGIYSCIVTSRDWSTDTSTKLSIAGTGEVFIEIQGPQGQGLELGCRSQGWLPKPTVQWVTEDGQGLSVDTEIHQDSEKLFSVWSRVTVTGEQVGKVTCQILNPLLQVEKETTVLLSGSVFPGAFQGVSASWIQLPLFLLTLAAGAVLVFRGRAVDALESIQLKDHQHLYQKILTLQEAFQNEQESTQRDLQLLRTDLKNELGLTIQANTTNALESMWKKDLHEVSQQVQTLQKAFQNTQVYTQRDLQMIRTDLKDELGKTVEANVTGTIAYIWQKDLLQLSQQIQTLKKTFQDMKVSTQRDLQMIRTDLENKLGRTVEANKSALESRLEKDLHEASQQILTLQKAIQNMEGSTQRDLQMIRTDLEHELGRTVEANTRTMESMWQKDLLQLSQQMQTLQEAIQNMEVSTQRDLQMIRADLENELGRTVEANTRTMESMWQKDLLQLSQQMQTLQEAIQNMEVSTQRDLQMIRADLENELGRTVEANTRTMESMWQKDLLQLSQQMQTLQGAFQNMQASSQLGLQIAVADLKNKLERTVKENTPRVLESLQLKDLQQLSQEIQALGKDMQTTLGSPEYDLQLLRTYLEKELDLQELRSYRGDVTLDADTAHPRLEISADGRRVKDTGVITFLLSNEKRFDSHLFVLAKEGYTSGKHYWEVSVGRRRIWALGIARESVTRKGTLTLCPENGFWVIACADGQDYWAYTNPWTRLIVTGNLSKIGIFLDIPAKQVSFYDVYKARALYTFSIADGRSQEGKLIPFFSTGLAAAEPDTEPLVIVQFSDDDE